MSYDLLRSIRPRKKCNLTDLSISDAYCLSRVLIHFKISNSDF